MANLVRLLLTYLTKSIISPGCSYEFKGSRTIAPEKNCPSPNSNANPKPNPNPNREGQYSSRAIVWTPTQLFSCEYCGIFKITSFEEHLRTDVSIRCYLDTINLKQSGCGTTCSFKIQNKNIKIISKLVNLKKNILQFSCNVYVMFYYEISWFYQHVKSGNLWFLNMYSVHGAKILDLSLEIMLSPSEGRITNLYNSNGFSFIPEQV